MRAARLLLVVATPCAVVAWGLPPKSDDHAQTLAPTQETNSIEKMTVSEKTLRKTSSLYDCTSGCNSGCLTGCDTGCTTGCDDGCITGCVSGCDETCTTGCDTGCTTGCDESCVCTSGCDTNCLSDCDTNCLSGCDKWGIKSCDKGCTSGCDGGCTSGCDDSCACTSGCDASCAGGCDHSCLTGCDDSCVSGCTSGCDDTCVTGCDGTCLSDCTSGCLGDLVDGAYRYVSDYASSADEHYSIATDILAAHGGAIEKMGTIGSKAAGLTTYASDAWSTVRTEAQGMVDELTDYANEYADIIAGFFSSLTCNLSSDDFVDILKELNSIDAAHLQALAANVTSLADWEAAGELVAVAACQSIWGYLEHLGGFHGKMALALVEFRTKCPALATGNNAALALGLTIDGSVTSEAVRGLTGGLSTMEAGMEIGLSMDVAGNKFCYIGACVGVGNAYPPGELVDGGAGVGAALTYWKDNGPSRIPGSINYAALAVDFEVPIPQVGEVKLSGGVNYFFDGSGSNGLKEFKGVGMAMVLGLDKPDDVSQWPVGGTATAGVCFTPVCTATTATEFRDATFFGLSWPGFLDGCSMYDEDYEPPSTSSTHQAVALMRGPQPASNASTSTLAVAAAAEATRSADHLRLPANATDATKQGSPSCAGCRSPRRV